jgi:hypothetical protein
LQPLLGVFLPGLRLGCIYSRGYLPGMWLGCPGGSVKWNLYHQIETCARFILVDYYHPAWDWNLDGAVNVLDLQLMVNAFLAMPWNYYPFY